MSSAISEPANEAIKSRENTHRGVPSCADCVDFTATGSGGVPFGFRLDVDGRTLAPVEDEQATIARARELAAEGR